MKRVQLVGLNACPRCQRGIAFLRTKDGERTIGVPLDASKALEISRNRPPSGPEKSLNALLLQFCMRFSCYPYRVVLDCGEEGLLWARIEVVKGGEVEVFSCSTTEGLGLAAAGGIPLYMVEEVFEHSQLLHPGDQDVDLVQPKPKVTLH